MRRRCPNGSRLRSGATSKLQVRSKHNRLLPSQPWKSSPEYASPSPPPLHHHNHHHYNQHHRHHHHFHHQHRHHLCLYHHLHPFPHLNHRHHLFTPSTLGRLLAELSDTSVNLASSRALLAWLARDHFIPCLLTINR